VKRTKSELADDRPKRAKHNPAPRDFHVEESPKTPGRKPKLSEPLKFCLKLVQDIAKKYYAYSWPFLAPVDAVALNLPDYHTRIKHPMDFGTIRQKLEDGMYKKPSEFESDVKLVFDNCFHYNPPTLEVYQMAKHVEAIFKSKYQQLPSSLPHLESRLPSSSDSDSDSETEAKKKKEREREKEREKEKSRKRKKLEEDSGKKKRMKSRDSNSEGEESDDENPTIKKLKKELRTVSSQLSTVLEAVRDRFLDL